ncbi:synaptosomal-associated protein 47 isoform X1 [Parasteatoda tepidariorum]|uniref:synaptosomal-associated protein 47 isoform X1 n=2 Tax=Parasteatoda tepidariorum TaxID=114398 RepID=UPI001C71ED89|nr:synaptosomal-associated protein 47 isoform X1 [Parasteatoda tepidariorum]
MSVYKLVTISKLYLVENLERLIQMASQQPVFQSNATYYDSPSKTWKTGTFALTNKAIQFHCDEYKNINIPLNIISGLEKRQSSFIYAAIVVSVASDKHWFSSFANRDSLYNLIVLFWREALLSKEHKTTSQPKSASTNLGKDLLNLLQESETTLVNAANSLSAQGQQIEETQTTVEDINTDLNVAERFIKNMSFTQSLLQLSTSPKLLNRQEPQKCFKVTFNFTDSSNENCYWKVGTLLVGENISLVDENRVNQLSVKYDEIISVEVMSSWKLCLKYSHDDTENACYIMCPKLEKLVKFLGSLSSISGKIFYLEDISFALNTMPSSSIASCSSSFLPSSTSPQRHSLLPKTDQIQEELESISEEDIQEISNMLNNLQDLAFEINKEQQSQMEKIESLMSNVEKTELRMKADSKKIKKLT